MSRPGDWNCRSCQHLNFKRRDSCQRCGEARHGGGGGGFGGRGSINGSAFGFTAGPDVRPGDWYCNVGNCGAHNFASRSSCFKCAAFKDDLASSGGVFDGDMSRGRGFGFGGGSGGGGGGSSRSRWKSGDWICGSLLSIQEEIGGSVAIKHSETAENAARDAKRVFIPGTEEGDE
ncbi:hypothetical protein L1887_19714 [Cichorium endivia]|nr:hypothetical protein L1887_19714 [Cichorium endivia]